MRKFLFASAMALVSSLCVPGDASAFGRRCGISARPFVAATAVSQACGYSSPRGQVAAKSSTCRPNQVPAQPVLPSIHFTPIGTVSVDPASTFATGQPARRVVTTDVPPQTYSRVSFTDLIPRTNLPVCVDCDKKK
jgi:hypothetical protein